MKEAVALREVRSEEFSVLKSPHRHGAAPARKAALVIRPPEKLPVDTANYKVFLAGSIEEGKASLWQDKVINSFAQEPVTFFNPRRTFWDTSWQQNKSDPNFRGQVDWELEAQERADRIIMFFEPNTRSVITLLELGLFARSGKLVVCCPEGYWRKGNVDIVCERYGVPMVSSLQHLIAMLRNEAR